jgi:hypothetical protein
MTVPEKFQNQDGTVNVQALMQSYQHLGGNPAEFIGGDGALDANRLGAAYTERERAASQTQASQGVVPPAPQIDTIQPETPAQVNWESIRLDESGRIPQATRQMLTKAGFPDQVINQHEQGLRSTQELGMRQIADALPNGMEDYRRVVEWANQTLPVEERQRMAEGLRGATPDRVIRSYYEDYIKANPQVGAGGGEPNLAGVVTGGAGGGAVSDLGAEPFMSRGDRIAAFRDLRYGKDPAYTQEVWARTEATARLVEQEQQASPTRGWVKRSARHKK